MTDTAPTPSPTMIRCDSGDVPPGIQMFDDTGKVAHRSFQSFFTSYDPAALGKMGLTPMSIVQKVHPPRCPTAAILLRALRRHDPILRMRGEG